MALAAGLFLLPLCIDPVCRITSSAQGIYSLMNNISSYTSNPDIIIALKQLDIEASIIILDRMTKELHVENMTKTLQESLCLLKKCMLDIETELNIIYDRLRYNRSLWTSWGAYKFSSNIQNLRLLKQQLDNRMQMFFLILNNNSKLKIKKDEEIDYSIIDAKK